jgi:hypothetical protein
MIFLIQNFSKEKVRRKRLCDSMNFQEVVICFTFGIRNPSTQVAICVMALFFWWNFFTLNILLQEGKVLDSFESES